MGSNSAVKSVDANPAYDPTESTAFVESDRSGGENFQLSGVYNRREAVGPTATSVGSCRAILSSNQSCSFTGTVRRKSVFSAHLPNQSEQHQPLISILEELVVDQQGRIEQKQGRLLLLA